jgi:hypothetical protein
MATLLPIGYPSRFSVTLQLFEKGNFYLLERFSRKSPLPPFAKRGVGGM